MAGNSTKKVSLSASRYNKQFSLDKLYLQLDKLNLIEAYYYGEPKKEEIRNLLKEYDIDCPDNTLQVLLEYSKLIRFDIRKTSKYNYFYYNILRYTLSKKFISDYKLLLEYGMIWPKDKSLENEKDNSLKQASMCITEILICAFKWDKFVVKSQVVLPDIFEGFFRAHSYPYPKIELVFTEKNRERIKNEIHNDESLIKMKSSYEEWISENKKHLNSPRSMMHLARCAVRDILYLNWNLPQGIEQLFIPTNLKAYLRLEF